MITQGMSIVGSKDKADRGLTWDQAQQRKREIDSAHDTGSPTSIWFPAEIVPDPEFGLYMVVCCHRLRRLCWRL